MITWIDKKSVLYHNKRKFKAGDSIPAGILSQNRIDMLLADKKIRLGEVKTDTKVKESVVMGQTVQNMVIGEVKVETKTNFKPKKSKAEIEDEELQRLIDEEAMK